MPGLAIWVSKLSLLCLSDELIIADPDLWTDPEIFRPERWFERPETVNYTFGVGSRMCIGIHMANRELYLLFTRLINSFKIVADESIDTNPITGVNNPMATVSIPKPFKVRFVPRDPAALEVALSIEKA